MQLELRTQGTTAIVTLHGEFLYSAHANIKPVVFPLIEQPEVHEIYLDLAEVSYLDSSALGLLLVIKEMAAVKKKTVSLRNPSQQVLKILKVVKFETIFPIVT